MSVKFETSSIRFFIVGEIAPKRFNLYFLSQVGDQVVALPEYRAWAELVAVPSKYVYKLPKDLSYLDAVTITMNYTVAYILLFEIAGLTEGKSILVHSVGGGVVSRFGLFMGRYVWIRLVVRYVCMGGEVEVDWIWEFLQYV